MGARRWFLGALSGLVAWVMVASPANANGWSLIELDRTHYVAGDRGTATAYVRVPERHEDLFDRGPFYLFALPHGSRVREGKPIPTDAVRIGTFTVKGQRNHWFELRAEFSAPQLGSDYFEVALCNDPCTVAGFGDALTGTISIVATRREATLLVENDRLRSRAFDWRRQARRAERRLEDAERQLQTQLDYGTAERSRLRDEISTLEDRLATAKRRAADTAARVPYHPWVVGGILLLTLVAGLLALVRRRRILPAAVDL